MKKISWKTILALQLVVMVYTLSSVAAKLASGYEALSLPFLLFYGVEILILGLYAIACLCQPFYGDSVVADLDSGLFSRGADHKKYHRSIRCFRRNNDCEQ